MKFRALTTALVLTLALAAGWIAYACLRETPPTLVARDDDALLWLRHEFNLSGDKLARIEKMHAAYQVVCEDHCRAIRDSRTALKRLRDSQAPAPDELAAAEANVREVDLICSNSLETHMREIADVIGGDDGRRYLSIVLPRIAGFDHAAAPGVDLDSANPHAGHSHH
jgi:hypothetical protein